MPTPAWLQPAPARRSHQSGIPSPPSSPRKKIRLLRDSEETEGDMPIETYLHRNNPYRSSTIQNPPPWPVLLEELPEGEQERYKQHFSRIEEILSDHEFPNIHDIPKGENSPKGRFEVVHMSKPGYPGAEIPIPVFIISFFDGGLPKKMGPARDAIKEFLWTHGLRVDVEIIVLRLVTQRLYPISSIENAVRVYNNAQQAIFNSVSTRLGRHFKALCMFNMGYSEDKTTPTIIIYVQPSACYDWSNLRMQLLALTTADPEIEVVFHPGIIQSSMNAGPSTTQAAAQDETGRAGSSIGVQGVTSSGTLGGYFELDFGGTIRKGFLTNSHVVRPRNAPEAIRQKAMACGSSPLEDDESRCIIVSPSDEDYFETIQGFENHINSLKTRKKDLELARGIDNSGDGDSHESGDPVIFKLSERIRDLENDLGRYRLIDRNLGTVFLSSGMALFNSRVSDWAFVELHNNRPFLFNQVPTYETHLKYFKTFRAAAPGSRATGFGRIEENEVYLKKGRTTGSTVGECNGVRLRMRTEPPRYINGIAQPQISETSEYVILSRKSDFCDKGDSGSLVYNEYGKICGLLWGDLIDTCCSTVALVTTFPDVLDAIKQKQGTLTDPGAS